MADIMAFIALVSPHINNFVGVSSLDGGVLV